MGVVVERFLGFQGVPEEVFVVYLADSVVKGQWVWLEGVYGDAELEQAQQFSEGGVCQEGKFDGQTRNIGEGGL